MKKVGFLIFCLFAMCSMAGKAQDVVADSTGYIVKDGSRFYSEADGWEKHYPFGTSWEGGHVAVYRKLVWSVP